MISFFDHPWTGTISEVAARVGGKGASLWAMTTQLGLPVPPGFTIGTEHAATGLTDALFAEILTALGQVGDRLGRTYGDPKNPLLVSVRSGASISMPGMMDTILNVGMTDVMLGSFGDAAFARTIHEAFLDQFGRAVPDYDRLILDDPHAILRAAITAVFESWNSPRAISYRKREGITDTCGTAVTIQAMVFGNCDAQSGTGVAFSRDPSTGAPHATGDWLREAQGEAVVGGTHATSPLSALADDDPVSHDALTAALMKLEHYYRDMVDVEFTIERGQLWILQARPGKRSPAAAARIAHDLVNDSGIALSLDEAILRMPASILDGSLTITRRDDDSVAVAHGLGVSPGLVTGQVALDCDSAIDMADAGNSVILVRSETSPEDVHGMGVSVGILTSSGGMMSHAALVAREWGIAAVCGADINIADKSFTAGPVRIKAGETVSIDGSTGEVFLGTVHGAPVTDPYVETVRRWAAEFSQQEKHYGQA